MIERASKWKFAVDKGGTFTDIVGLNPEGFYHIIKLLSSSSSYKDASIEGIRRILRLEADEPLPGDRIERVRFGTTVATNALLERKGCKTALLITEGFSDLLEIGYQNRPDIFSLCIKKLSPLYSVVIEVNERIDCRGRIVKDFDSHNFLKDIEKLLNSGVNAIAVVFMHSWINPDHEILCEEILRRRGFSNILLSHRTVNLIKIVSRGQSTLVDAYLSAVIEQYLNTIKGASGNIPLEFMQSSGTLSPAGSFKGRNAVLSGPAGGLLAAASIAKEKAFKGVIGFDMGGTSTDVSRYDGEFERIFEQDIGGVQFQTEVLNIITVAAGGGSILNFDGRKMTAGPESAGSNPGPACYGFGGPLTITDANLLTGRLIPEYFPRTFGEDGRSSIDAGIVKEKFLSLSCEINSALGTGFTPQDVAIGFLRVSNEKMAMAIKEISVSRGFDVRDYALVCFGGAGGQHACSIASLLDIETIIIHPLSSVMSAYGIGLSKPAIKSERTILRPLKKESLEELSDLFMDMEKQLLTKRQGEDKPFNVKREIDLRPGGAETFLTMQYGGFSKMVGKFREKYRKLFGFIPPHTDLEVVNVRVEVRESADLLIPYTEERKPVNKISEPILYQELHCSEYRIKAPVYLRDSLSQFMKIKGPALIIDDNFTVVVEPGFEAETDRDGIITIKSRGKMGKVVSGCSGRPDPVLLEIFNNLFMGIATEMGLSLKNTAHSVNMKERLDFSCAVFDYNGNLVANAPHIPVHLGSMADAVKTVLNDNRDTMRPGDVYLTNNPYKGGSHLSDMTVVCPVFSDRGETAFFTAARGHHSDVGGTTPGSMPPSAGHIIEEGVLIDNFLLVRDHIFREEALRRILSTHKYPVRNIPERMSDFRAQITACHKGVVELRRIIGKYGPDLVMEYMRHIQENAEYSVKKALNLFLKDGNQFYSTFEDHMDDGTPIKVKIYIEGGDNPPGTLKAIIDFTGTGAQHLHDNLNAPHSVTRSAILYVLRALINKDIPLNSGCLIPVDIIIPPGTILSPFYPAPVASGNVETSQRVVDVLLGAFGIASASQGTMNNLLFEVEGDLPYYETIAGGAGAIEECHGASGVQVHMTNTRITDPEILEFRHPGVRLERFSLRRGSGGRGRFCGGDGVIREIKFLKPAAVSIISERRMYPPYGINGGQAGSKGKNIYKTGDGKTVELKHREALKVNGNDSLIIKTPGGGGYGSCGKR